MSRVMIRAILHLALALPAVAPLAVRAEEPWPRQSQMLPFDAGTVERSWFDLSVSYRETDVSDRTPQGSGGVADGRVAWSPRSHLEFGVEGSYVARDDDESEYGASSGLGDTLAWAKYRLPGGDSVVFSAGAFASIPTGDVEKWLGTGNFEGGVFLAGGARTQGKGFVEAYFGMRWNGDIENLILDHPLSGKPSFLSGFGGVYEASSGIEVFSSLHIETSRYEEVDDIVRVTGGARWVLSRSWRFQLLASAGVSGAASRLTLGAGAVFAP